MKRLIPAIILALVTVTPTWAQAVHHGVCGTYKPVVHMVGGTTTGTWIFVDNDDAPGTCPDRLHNGGGPETISIYGSNQTSTGTKPNGTHEWCYESVSGFIYSEYWFDSEPVGGRIVFEATLYFTPEPGVLNQKYCADRPSHIGNFVLPISIEGDPTLGGADNAFFNVRDTLPPSLAGTMQYLDKIQ